MNVKTFAETIAVCIRTTNHRLPFAQEILRTQKMSMPLEERVTECMEHAMQELRHAHSGSKEEGEMDDEEEMDEEEDEKEEAAQLFRDALGAELSAWLVGAITVGRCRPADAHNAIQLAGRLTEKGLVPPKLCLSLFSDYAEMATVDDVVDLLNQPNDVVNAFELAKKHGGVSPKDVVEAIHPLERCLSHGSTASTTAVSGFVKELSRVFPNVCVHKPHFVQKFNTDGVPQSIAAVCKVLQVLQYKTLEQAVEHQAIERNEFFALLFVVQQSIKAMAHPVNQNEDNSDYLDINFTSTSVPEEIECAVQHKSNQLVFLVKVLTFLNESIAKCHEQNDKERLKHSQQSVYRLLSELTSEADVKALKKAQEPQKDPVVPKCKNIELHFDALNEFLKWDGKFTEVAPAPSAPSAQ